MNRTLLQGAFDIAEALINAGIGAVIAGGCARDLYFGVAPKDIDIICAGASPELVTETLDNLLLPYESFPKYHTGSDSDRLQGVWKLHGAEIEIPDLRAGFSYVIAALAAEGESKLTNTALIERGYENLVPKLVALGAGIVGEP